MMASLVMSTVTGYLIILTLVAIIVYDIWVYAVYGVEATISVVVRKVHEKFPLLASIIAFAAGCLWGHFFW